MNGLPSCRLVQLPHRARTDAFVAVCDGGNSAMHIAQDQCVRFRGPEDPPARRRVRGIGLRLCRDGERELPADSGNKVRLLSRWVPWGRSEEHTAETQSPIYLVFPV